MADLRELIKKWRIAAMNAGKARAKAFTRCADELERALAAQPAPASVGADDLIKLIAAVPIENFDSGNRRTDDHPLFGLDSWTLTVGHVRLARRLAGTGGE